MRTSRLILFSCLVLAGCGEPGGAPLVSAQSPPGMSHNSEPQPLNSLPPGAANFALAPNAVQQNGLSYTFGARSPR